MGQSEDLESREYWERRMLEIEPEQEKHHPYAGNDKWHEIRQALEAWIWEFGLNRGRVVEIGSGTGLLQDLAEHYVGIDFARNASRYMHKPFCVASAEALPFADNSFQGCFSVWVLEHVNQPERMLSEMRRVLVPGGSLFMSAAYGVGDWASTGIHLRQFSELTAREAMARIGVAVRGHVLFKATVQLPRRIWLLARYLITRQPIDLEYTTITPNYVEFLDNDSDACISIDSFSVLVFFLSRGDSFLTKSNVLMALLLRAEPQIYVVNKSVADSQH